ncbi:MAG: chemotaxis protein CheD [Actinobacteria bacterium]|nr:MAG: chemotaxis protein CheD [Actinomycetota bacterium]
MDEGARTPRGIAGLGKLSAMIDVAVGTLGFGDAPAVLTTAALGSCVGVALYDPIEKRGALAHVMLPKPVEAGVDSLPERFAEYAVPAMAGRLEAMGSRKPLLVAKLAGGSAMFRADSTLASIGERNIAEVKRQLTLLRIPVVAEDIGGSHARTVELYLDTGTLVVRSHQHGVKEL